MRQRWSTGLITGLRRSLLFVTCSLHIFDLCQLVPCQVVPEHWGTEAQGDSPPKVMQTKPLWVGKRESSGDEMCCVICPHMANEWSLALL